MIRILPFVVIVEVGLLWVWIEYFRFLIAFANLRWTEVGPSVLVYQHDFVVFKLLQNYYSDGS